jgi:hypothetical protein
MEQNSKWKCSHLKGETLTAVKRYNDRQFVVESKETKKRYLVHKDLFSEPHLNLAHVNNMDCQLVPKEA